MVTSQAEQKETVDSVSVFAMAVVAEDEGHQSEQMTQK